jgi:hypothetical protein
MDHAAIILGMLLLGGGTCIVILLGMGLIRTAGDSRPKHRVTVDVPPPDQDDLAAAWGGWLHESEPEPDKPAEAEISQEEGDGIPEEFQQWIRDHKGK